MRISKKSFENDCNKNKKQFKRIRKKWKKKLKINKEKNFKVKSSIKDIFNSLIKKRKK